MTLTVAGLGPTRRSESTEGRLDRVLPYLRFGLPVVAAVNGLLISTHPLDVFRFAPMGGQVLSGNFAVVYASSWNQAGPLQLILSWLLMLGGSDAAPSRWIVALLSALMVFAAMRIARSVRSEALAGLLCLAWLAAQEPWKGHPVEVVISIGWVLALRWQRSGRWVLSAAALAATAAVAPWAVLAFPALLAVASLPRALRTALLATGFGLLAYLPFVLTGHFAMFSQVWFVFPDSLAHLVWPGRALVGWPLRLAQAVIVGGGTALVAARSRSTSYALYAAPLAAGLLRVITDPQTYDYYWISVAVLVVLWIALTPEPASRTQWLGLIALMYLPWAMSAGGARVIGPEYLGGVISLAALVWLIWPRRDPTVPSTAR